jgi:hypothetical protein
MNLIRSRHKIVKGIGKLQPSDHQNNMRLRWRKQPELSGFPPAPFGSTRQWMRAEMQAEAGDRTINPVIARSSVAVQPLTDPTTMQWVSSRSLDFCLLAVCSCMLAVLCHQSVPVSIATAPASGLTAAASSPMQLDLTLKAGLYTTGQQKGSQLEEED